MLIAIDCDEFKEKGIKRSPIQFHRGLNVIVGNDNGGNSIGKSSMLMILDFVFGGSDYYIVLKSIQKNIGAHTIKFAFEFDGIPYYFTRSTTDYKFVYKCDSLYNPLENGKTPLSEYLKFLSKMYKIDSNTGSFRQVAGRFFRIYNRPNMDEKRPLDIAEESEEDSLKALLNLFGLKTKLEPYESIAKQAKDELTYLKTATAKGDRPSAKNPTEIKGNLARIVEINKELEDINEGLATTESIKLEGLTALDQPLKKLLYQRARLNAILKNIGTDVEPGIQWDDNFDRLSLYFPDTNIAELSKIKAFHEKIQKILQAQVSEERNEVFSNLQVVNEEIRKLKAAKKDLIEEMKIKSTLAGSKIDHARNLLEEKELLENRNKNRQQLCDAEALKKEYDRNLAEQRKLLAEDSIKELNSKMSEINKQISGTDLTNPPTITLKENGKNYDFSIQDDQGKGSQYKGMIIFDLAILEQTPVPALIHDSDLLKPVADNPIDGIAKAYLQTNKQIFVSIDKLSSYNKEAETIFRTHQVLELYPNGGELFGRAWNKPV